jgi:ribonuclease R
MVIPLRLAEADPVSGSLRFELPEGGSASRRPVRDGRRPMIGKRGRPPGIRHKGGKKRK